MSVCFHLLGIKLFGLHFEPLISTQKFQISPRVSYTLTEIQDRSPGLLHPYRNSGSLPGSLTPIQKFRISPRVSYTHTEIQDLSSGLLHPHRNSGSLPGSLTPTQKFGITPRVSYTLTEIRDHSPSLLHPHRTFRILPRVSFTLTPGSSPWGLPTPFRFAQHNLITISFSDLNYESSLGVVPKTTQPTLTKSGE